MRVSRSAHNVFLFFLASRGEMLATMLSSKFLLLWLLVTVPMQDPLCFSAQSGNSLFPDSGVNAGSFTAGGSEANTKW